MLYQSNILTNLLKEFISIWCFQVNAGKMESASEKWMLIVGNLALKQVSHVSFPDYLQSVTLPTLSQHHVHLTASGHSARPAGLHDGGSAGLDGRRTDAGSSRGAVVFGQCFHRLHGFTAAG